MFKIDNTNIDEIFNDTHYGNLKTAIIKSLEKSNYTRVSRKCKQLLRKVKW